MVTWRHLFAQSGLDIVFRADDPTSWNETHARLLFRPVDYMSSALDYHLAYHRGHGGDWHEASCVLLLDNAPVGLWPLTFNCVGGADQNDQRMLVMPPLFIDTCPAGTVKTYTAECLSIAHRLAVELGLAQWSSESRYVGRRDIDRWHTVAMEQGAVCKVQHDLFVDLALTLPEIKSCFRRSYRSLVTSGSRLWRVEVVGAPGDAAVWDEFRQLHATVAGRVTRSLESWQLQHEALANDEGFLVVLRDEDERMVGAGYFMCSSDEGLYAVGAYDRSLFSKPLGHVVQYRAITELKQRGCRWYRIGTHCFPGDQPTPSAKELSIASFKEGFASHAFPGFVLTRATDECVRQAE